MCVTCASLASPTDPNPQSHNEGVNLVPVDKCKTNSACLCDHVQGNVCCTQKLKSFIALHPDERVKIKDGRYPVPERRPKAWQGLINSLLVRKTVDSVGLQCLQPQETCEAGDEGFLECLQRVDISKYIAKNANHCSKVTRRRMWRFDARRFKLSMQPLLAEEHNYSTYEIKYYCNDIFVDEVIHTSFTSLFDTCMLVEDSPNVRGVSRYSYSEPLPSLPFIAIDVTEPQRDVTKSARLAAV